MLDSVASGKKLPEKNLIVLGGTPSTQKDFIETLAAENNPKKSQHRYKRKPPIANEFALGYTYQDVLDTDHEDLLARLSLYLLAEPSPAFASLVKPLLTSRTIPETLIVILLDWIEPWRWIRQLRNWIRFLRSITSDLSDDAQESAEETMKEWQQQRRGRSYHDAGGGTSGTESNVVIPLSQGEWDEPLGLPLSVVCHGADKIDTLETQHGWREEDFDFVLQFLRTVLMKHGSSLIYTSVSAPNSLPALVHSSLGIQSLLKKQTLKHNIIDRDKIFIPPNWDSWGKIRVLREGFDVEGISKGWSDEILLASASETAKKDESSDTTSNNTTESPAAKGTVLHIYEENIRDPRKSRESGKSKSGIAGVEVEAPNMQAFLGAQSEIMERLKKEEDEAAAAAQEKDKAGKGSTQTDSHYSHRYTSTTVDGGPVSDQIGPVEFNMGGIQVNADEMLQRLKNREGRDKPRSEVPTPNTQTPSKTGGDHKAQNEQLANFFSSLMTKNRSGSPFSRKTDDDG
ncbi:MAG: hypothetical protein Q9195_005602 [Heterodermia aff. obscurata]